MNSLLKTCAPGLVLLIGTSCWCGIANAKPEYTKKEHKGCTFCHSSALTKPSELTEAGKYYAEHKSLAGYKK